MPKRDEDNTDEEYDLISRALYVEPLNYPMDMKKIPENGHEYIYQVRQEELSLLSELANGTSESNDHSSVLSSKLTVTQYWKFEECDFFSRLVVKLKLFKSELIKKYSQKKTPPVGNGKDWCYFTLGSDACIEIYGDRSDACEIYGDKGYMECQGCPPYLSIVLYLNQHDILTILESMRKWFYVIGMTHDLCRWIYSLFACLVKPLAKDHFKFLESFVDDLKKKSKDCKRSDKKQIHLIIALIIFYFDIEAQTRAHCVFGNIPYKLVT